MNPLVIAATLIFTLMYVPQYSYGVDPRELLDIMMEAERVQAFKDQQIVRPTLEERKAISSILDQKPRPDSLYPADVEFLESLLDKAAWTGAERRIMHLIWEEVSGSKWPAK